MEEFVAYLVKNLVSSPNQVQVTSKDDNGVLRVEIRVAQEDVGKVIGRRGNTINALRTISRTVATRLGRHVHLELIQPEGKPEDRNESMAFEEDVEVVGVN